LHDAVVSSINTHSGESLGSINWVDPLASSLSELVYDLGTALNKDLLDGQIATALLTGIVAETARFSNEKTTPQTMSASAALMAAGANQQLVASKLEEPAPVPVTPTPEPMAAAEPESSEETPAAEKPEPGTLEIQHEDAAETADVPAPASEPDEGSGDAPAEASAEPDLSEGLSSLIGEVRSPDPLSPPTADDAPVVSKAPSFITEPLLNGRHSNGQ